MKAETIENLVVKDLFDDAEDSEDSFQKEGPTRCIFLCEFHPTVGPKITCQYPDNYISKELFDSVSVYIITKAELLRSTITVSSRTVHYEPVVMKLSDYLVAMEIESNFLSEGSSSTKLTPILKQVLEDLNNKGECALTEGPTATHLKVVKLRSNPTPVADHQVPIFIKSLPTQQWDLTTQQVAPFIDGFNHIARIASLADVENNLVKACVQNLVYYGAVALIPLFQYGNVYCTAPKLKMLTQDVNLQNRCLNFVARTYRQLPNLKDVFRMYAAMTRGTTIKDLCIRFNPASLKINERKLVQFGVLEGLIRRVHKYPVYLGESLELQKSMSGVSSMDEVCCFAGITAQQLEDQVERDHNVVLLWK
ncbi:GATOR complex protein NPRL2 isoform X2 [Agrilus planipennis]|uniref:GATOR complex protein NPRL2 isoform X2 n=1 Tax=Agrilus planipennis TaxID=224129 RepID=A0A1W4XD19_AGRPL|nr:GATOR complex protein NPRL2 isoform X2 [Agrilus planipennis]